MSENKEYVSRSDELGNIHISEEVLAGIAAAAALEVEGVTGLAGGTMSEQLLGRKKLSKGITILWESDNITINVSIQIRYGGTIPEVARKVQEAIVTSVEDTSGLKNGRIASTVRYSISYPWTGSKSLFPIHGKIRPDASGRPAGYFSSASPGSWGPRRRGQG
mgnify:CR=1 FL=1